MADASRAAERMAAMLTRSGMQRMAARVLCTILFADQDTITAGEIAERLKVSAGTVSGALKLLDPVGLLERVPVPGSRRDHYRLRDHAWLQLMSSQNHVLDELLGAADEGIDVLGEDSIAGLRLAEMRDFYRYLLAGLPELLESWQRDRGERGHA